MYGHTLPFSQLIVCRFVTLVAKVMQSSQTTKKGWIFLVIHSGISILLPVVHLPLLGDLEGEGDMTARIKHEEESEALPIDELCVKSM